MSLINLIGEYDCKVDNKGRMLFPMGLLKQLPENEKEKFIINRSVFQKCLTLYTMQSWNKIVNDLSKLNRFNKKNDDFIRQYTNGAVLVEMDSANRLLLPKRLMDYASIDKDLIVTANLDKIEIWSSEKYNQLMQSYDPDAFGTLAEEVMGNINRTDDVS
jgi:MraZ protein